MCGEKSLWRGAEAVGDGIDSGGFAAFSGVWTGRELCIGAVGGELSVGNRRRNDHGSVNLQ